MDLTITFTLLSDTSILCANVGLGRASSCQVIVIGESTGFVYQK